MSSHQIVRSCVVLALGSLLFGMGCVDLGLFSSIQAGYTDDCTRVAVVWTEQSEGGTLLPTEVSCATVEAQASPDPEMVLACAFELAPPARCTGADASDVSDSSDVPDSGDVPDASDATGDDGEQPEVGPETETFVEVDATDVGGDEAGPDAAETDVPLTCDEDCDVQDTVCQDFSCVGGTCVPENLTADCDDGDACTHGDVCAAGACAGTAYDCTPEATCQESTCDGEGGCTDPVTDEGWCASAGTVCVEVGQPIFPSYPCYVCTATGVLEPANDGSACDSIADGGCTTGVCAGGLCGDTVPKEDGTSCELAGADCVATSACTGGECLATATSDGSCFFSGDCLEDQSMVGKCRKCEAGSVIELNGTTCDDGNACTVGEVCSIGTCVSPAPVDCDDSHDCTTDLCDPQSGTCVYTNQAEGAVCDDGNPCTLSSSCDLFASCEPALPVLKTSLDYGIVAHGSGQISYIGGGVRLDGSQVFGLWALAGVAYVVSPSATTTLTPTYNDLSYVGRVINSAGDVETIRTLDSVALNKVTIFDTSTYASGSIRAPTDVGGPSIPFPMNQFEYFLAKYDDTGDASWLYELEGGGVAGLGADANFLYAVIFGAGDVTLTPHTGVAQVLTAGSGASSIHLVRFAQETGVVQGHVLLGTGANVPRVEVLGNSNTVAISVAETLTIAPGGPLEEYVTGPATAVLRIESSNITWTVALADQLISLGERSGFGSLVAHGTSVSRITSTGGVMTEDLDTNVVHLADWSGTTLGLNGWGLTEFSWGGEATAQVAMGDVPYFNPAGSVFGNKWLGGGEWGAGLREFGPGGQGLEQNIVGNLAAVIYRLSLNGQGGICEN